MIETSLKHEMNDGNNESISDRFRRAVKLMESSPDRSIELFTSLQHQIASLALFSSNEHVQDVSTQMLPLLAVEHYLAASYLQLPTMTASGQQPPSAESRKRNVTMASDLWASFIQRMLAMELLDDDGKKQYKELIDLSAAMNEGEEESPEMQMIPPPNRDVKIARYKAKKAVESELQRLESLVSRRNRLGCSDNDEMDGHDQESLARSLALSELQLAIQNALEEWAGALRELPMIAMMARAQQAQQLQQSRYNNSTTNDRGQVKPKGSGNNGNELGRSGDGGGLKVTRITKDGMTGQLQIRKEEIRSGVFKPGWNQPTMSLQELAEREVAAAMEREERQKKSEAAAANAPRRFEHVVKDGMEDDADLVDASAALDQKWDDWKDENPRGSGNKRGDVGDRNF